MIFAPEFPHSRFRLDDHAITNPYVLIDDGSFDLAIFSDPQSREVQPGPLAAPEDDSYHIFHGLPHGSAIRPVITPMVSILSLPHKKRQASPQQSSKGRLWAGKALNRSAFIVSQVFFSLALFSSPGVT